MRKSILMFVFLLVSAAFVLGQTTITNVLVTATTGTTATIQWTTSTPATSQIFYGLNQPSPLPYSNTENFTLTTSHSMTLNVLQAGPLYYFAVSSVDGSGIPAQSATLNFSLCGTPLIAVSGTVNTYYQNGSFTLTWLPPAGAASSPTVCGQAVTTPVTGSLSSAGSFTATVADASKVVPGPGTWQIQATDAGNLAPITIVSYLSATSQNVSIPLQAAAAAAGLTACITNTVTHAVFPSICAGAGTAPPAPAFSVPFSNAGVTALQADSTFNFNVATHTLNVAGLIDSGLTAGTAPVCPNGTGGALTTAGCAVGSTPAPPAFAVQAANSVVSGLTADSNVTVNTALHRPVDKLPTVDVLHGDFASACPNAADPTATLDSTCAIQAAINYSETHPVSSGNYPLVYLSSGTYLIGSAGIGLRITQPISLAGSVGGKNTVTLLLAPGGEDGIDILSAGGGPTQISDISITGQGDVTTGTLLEILADQQVQLSNITMFNHGGRGLSGIGSSERMKSVGLIIGEVRWPIVFAGSTNEENFHDTQIINPGVSLTPGYPADHPNGYCYTVNCTGGFFATANAGVPSSLNTWAPNTYYKGGTIICEGSCSSGGGVEQQAQLDFTSGTSAPSWNATYLGLTSETNGVTVTNAWQNRNVDTVLKPENHAAVIFEGAVCHWDGGSIKSLVYMSGMIPCGEDAFINSTYFESFEGLGGPTHSIITGGYPEHLVTSGAVTGTGMVVPLTSVQWVRDFVSSPADVAANPTASVYYWFPCDYNAASTTQSTCAPTGVLQDMFEVVRVDSASSDGNLYFFSRNNSGSTAPANTAWPAGSFLVKNIFSGGFNAPTLLGNHLQAATPAANGYVYGCTDNTKACGEIMIGNQPDGQVVKGPGMGTSFPLSNSDNATIFLQNNSTFFAGQEFYGLGSFKILSGGNITTANPAPQNSGNAYPSTALITGFFVGVGKVFAATWNSGQNVAVASIDGPGYHLSAPGFTSTVNQAQISQFTDMDDFGNPFVGYQFANSTGWTDSNSTATKSYRFLQRGGPSETPGFDAQAFLNGGWADIFGVSATSMPSFTGTLGSTIPNIFPYSIGALSNLAQYSHDFSTAWENTVGTAPTLTTGQTDPFGGTTATQFVTASGMNTWTLAQPSFPLTANTTYRLCVIGYGATGTEQLLITAANNFVFFVNLAAGTSYRSYCGIVNVGSVELNRAFQISTDSSETFTLAGVDIQLASNSPGYIPTTGTPIGTPAPAIYPLLSNSDLANPFTFTPTTPAVGQVACVKSLSPVVIGQCTTVVSSTGACTCN